MDDMWKKYSFSTYQLCVSEVYAVIMFICAGFVHCARLPFLCRCGTCACSSFCVCGDVQVLESVRVNLS